jgi:hypothetical protein
MKGGYDRLDYQSSHSQHDLFTIADDNDEDQEEVIGIEMQRK